jgi:L-threonylcarbamoyladenylate synthase
MLKKAINILKSGGVIAFPTETVFGIGALLSQPKAIRRIYKIKKRTRSKPLQVLVASLRQAKELGKFSDQAEKLAKKSWPGPLTLVVYKTSKVPKLITGGTNKVGLRIPAHRMILKLIRAVGPIVATSANEAGEKPALTVNEVKQKLPALDYILPGRVKHGKASRVIDATAGMSVLRS